MEFTMGAGTPPAGNYFGQFIGAEPFSENADRFGEGVLLKWRVIGGEFDGAETGRICSARLTPKSALGKMAVAIKGGAIQPGESFDFAGYVGTFGRLMVEPTESGGTRVGVFLREAPPGGKGQPVATQATEQV